MGKKRGQYTALGFKIAKLAANQAELGRILGLSQQSVSGKLTGRIAVTLIDLEKLAEHFDVPLVYFFVGPEDATAEQARIWEKVLSGPDELRASLEVTSRLPRPFLRELLEVVRAMQDTALACEANSSEGEPPMVKPADGDRSEP